MEGPQLAEELDFNPVMLDDLQTEALMPAQYYGIIANSKHYTPEHKLLMAVLVDAINCYLSTNDYEHARAHQWFMSPRQYFMSYHNICDLLNVDPHGLWSQLKDWPRGKRKYKRIDHHSLIY